MLKHDAAAIRLDGAENQLHDAFEKLIQIENMADGLDGLVHDAEIGQRGLEPGRAAGVAGTRENPAAFRFVDGFDDRRRKLIVLLGDHADAAGEIGRGLPLRAARAVNEDALPDADVIARRSSTSLTG